MNPDLSSVELLLQMLEESAMLLSVTQEVKEYSAPLTSFDWNQVDPNLCLTCSVDTTCTAWDIQTQQAKTQLIAHDKEVFDVAFSDTVHTFCSVGADGSARMFDLRYLSLMQRFGSFYYYF